MAGRLRRSRHFAFVPQSRVLAALHARNTVKPQERHNQKRQKIQQKIPTAEPGWRHLYLSCCLASALRTLNDKTHTPQLLPVETGLSVVLCLPARFHALGLIKLLGKPASSGLNANLDFQIARNRTAGRRFHEHIKSPGANIRMSPERNYTRPNFLVLDNGKRRAVVCASWHRQRQQEHNQKPNRNSSRTCRAIQHRQ